MDRCLLDITSLITRRRLRSSRANTMSYDWLKKDKSFPTTETEACKTPYNHRICQVSLVIKFPMFSINSEK